MHRELILPTLEANQNVNSPSTGRARPIPGTHLPSFVFQTGKDLARHAAHMIARLIRERSELGQTTVLGLPTGSTPVGTYRELIRLHREQGLDFSQVVVFSLDEYYGLSPDNPQSHGRWLREHFLNQVNIPSDNIHVLDSQVPANDVELHCRRYDESISERRWFRFSFTGHRSQWSHRLQ